MEFVRNLLYGKNQEQMAELNDFKSLQFHQKGSMFKAGAKESMVAEKKPSTLQRNKRKDSLKATQESARPHPS